jgi:hypothetical protein
MMVCMVEKTKNNASNSAAQGIVAILQVCTAGFHVPCIHKIRLQPAIQRQRPE